MGRGGLESVRRVTEAGELPIVYRIGAFDSNKVRTGRELSCYGMVPRNGDPQLHPELLRLALDLYESHRQSRRAYEEHNDLLQSLRETVIAHDREGTVLFLNRQAALTLGDEPERFIGKNLVISSLAKMRSAASSVFVLSSRPRSAPQAKRRCRSTAGRTGSS